MEKSSFVSQSDVARAAKVSRSTVSRALINHPEIPAHTRKRILAIAEKLGYRKNAIVSMLGAQIRSSRLRRVESTLAYLTTLDLPGIPEFINPTYYKFYIGAKNRAAELGYGLDTIWRKEGAMTSERVTKILAARGIKGIVLAPRPNALAHVKLEWEKFVTVAVGHPLPAPKVSVSTAWAHDQISKALRMIGKYGYKRVGFSIAPESDRYSQYSFSARYHLYQNMLEPKYRVPLMCRPASKERFDRARFESWFTKNRPEVLLCVGSLVYEWLSDMGMGVPGDVACVDICLADDSGTRAGVFERPEVIGAAAVDLVVEQLHGNSMGLPLHPKVVLTEGLWVDGPTLPRKR